MTEIIQREIKKAILKITKKISEVEVEIPSDKKFGDYSSNIALKIGKLKKKNPLEIAEEIKRNLLYLTPNICEKIEVALPGFVNFYLSQNFLFAQLEKILKEKEKFGKTNIFKNKKIQIEYGGVNPTGPMHLGHGRNLYIGDVLANVLKFEGAKITKEHYINDMGTQITIFGRSVELRYLELLGKKIKFPSDAYQGDYPLTLAREVLKKEGKKYLNTIPEKRLQIFTKKAILLSIVDIKKVSKKAGVNFDSWFRESSLYKEDFQEMVFKILEDKGFLYFKDLALWFKTTNFGVKKDDVVIRSDKTPTYFGSDILYHYNKFKIRKFDEVVNIWGANNSGQIERLKAAIAAFGEKEKLKILVYQSVRLIKEGKEVVMSKRKGKYIALGELIDQVGKDVVRFFFVMRSPDTHLDFDLSLALEHSEKNPVFYAQYAYARIASIFKKCPKNALGKINFSLLKEKEELELIKEIIKLPDIIKEVALSLQIQRLPFYAISLAEKFHLFYDKHKVISENKDLTATRIELLKAVQIVFENVFNTIGIKPLKKM